MRSGDLGALKHSLNTTANGSRIHRRIQQRRGKSYQAEAYLSQTVRINHHPYLIHGRADGIVMNKTPLIEEIKTSDVPFIQLPQSIRILYWGQVKMYAHLLMHQHPQIQRVQIRLTYVQTPEQITTHRTQNFTLDQAQHFFDQVLERYRQRISLRTHIIKRRNLSARQLQFPFKHFRPGQYQLAAAVYKTILFHKHLFAEAPTGTGKTISTLFPSIKAMGEHHLNRIFYLTAKQSTRQVAEAANRLMMRHGLKMKSITLTAKDKIIFPEEVNVDPQKNPYMVGYYNRLRPAVKDILKHHDQITTITIQKYARKYTIDPFEFSLDVSIFCDVIICDYNYLFDPQVYLQRFFSTKDSRNFFLIDEAHNLVSRSREMYSASLSSQELVKLISILKKHRFRTHSIIPALTDLKKAFRTERQTLNQQRRFSLNLIPPIKGFNQMVQRVTHTLHKWLPKQKPSDDLTRLVIHYDFQCVSYLKISEFYDATYRTRIIHNLHHHITLRQFCIDPSKHLAHSLNLGGGAVLFSATLSPLDYYRRVLGNEKDSLAYQLPSPFQPDHQKVLITNYIQTTYRQRQANQPVILRTIYQLITGRHGHYLIFFPSYQYLDSVATDFQQRYPQFHVLIQTPHSSPEQQKRFIQHFRKRTDQTLVGFAIMGSNFAEGIDLKGSALIGVGIVSVGLPKINAETNLVRDYFDDQNHRGFEFAYQLPGLNKVLQAAGRLIRSESDVGIVALIDSRFNQFRYRRFLPESWRPQSINTLTQFKRTVHRFWQNHSAKK